MTKCNNCGFEDTKDSKFCKKCGTKFKSEKTANAVLSKEGIEEEITNTIGQVSVLRKNLMSPRETRKYKRQWNEGNFHIPNSKTCFIFLTNQRILVTSLHEKRTTSIGVFRIPVPVHKKELDSETILNLPYSNIIQYKIMSEKIKKGDNCNLSIEAQDLYCTFQSTDQRHMDILKNKELYQKIIQHYYDIGLIPRETWSSLFFNVPFAKHFKKLLDRTNEEIVDAKAIEPLLAALEDESPEIRKIAGNAVLKIGKLRAMDKLNVTSKDFGDEIGDIAKEAIDKIKSIHEDNDKIESKI